MAQTIVQLHRSPGTPWGFRLQGGRDFSSELSVKKIQPGSPADGQLRAGDRIIGIGNTSTQNMTHMQANHLIKSAGNAVQFTIVRGPSSDFSNIKPTGPVKFSPWKYNQQQQQPQNHY
ncbi:LIM domain-binding protein 3 [Bulinus truncatus]|nr:LIM domain-binding protein 3 [Bulinus truncatus]